MLGGAPEHFKGPSVTFETHKKALCGARVRLQGLEAVRSISRVHPPSKLQRLEALPAHFKGSCVNLETHKKNTLRCHGRPWQGCLHYSSKDWTRLGAFPEHFKVHPSVLKPIRKHFAVPGEARVGLCKAASITSKAWRRSGAFQGSIRQFRNRKENNLRCQGR